MKDAEYLPLTRHSPLTDPWRPIFQRENGDSVDLSLTIREAHCNARGFAHGGFISSMADLAMGLSAVHAARRIPGGGTSGVTLSLTLDFVDAGQIGELVEFRPAVLKVGRSIAFTECRVVSAERLIARASGTFRIVSVREPGAVSSQGNGAAAS